MKSLGSIVKHLKDEIENITFKKISHYDIDDHSKILDDLGLDSLDYAQLMLSGEEFCNVKIDDNKVDWSKVKTVKQLAELLHNQQK